MGMLVNLADRASSGFPCKFIIKRPDVAPAVVSIKDFFEETILSNRAKMFQLSMKTDINSGVCKANN